jgi:hypothetical protein
VEARNSVLAKVFLPLLSSQPTMLASLHKTCDGDDELGLRLDGCVGSMTAFS